MKKILTIAFFLAFAVASYAQVAVKEVDGKPVVVQTTQTEITSQAISDDIQKTKQQIEQLQQQLNLLLELFHEVKKIEEKNVGTKPEQDGK